MCSRLCVVAKIVIVGRDVKLCQLRTDTGPDVCTFEFAKLIVEVSDACCLENFEQLANGIRWESSVSEGDDSVNNGRKESYDKLYIFTSTTNLDLIRTEDSFKCAEIPF